MSQARPPREYGIITATALVVANMVGSGIFTTSGKMAALLPHSIWVLICWLLGGLIAICGALCYAELATRMPEEGGEYFYLKQLYHPILGFLTGWTSFFVGFSAPIALSALGFSAYLFSGLHQHVTPPVSSFLPFSMKIFAAFLIILFTFLHYLGGRLGPRVQNILTGIKILLISGMATTGLLYGNGNWNYFSTPNTKPLEIMSFGTAMMMVMFSYSGWNASAYVAGELRNPRKTLPISLISGTFIVICLYLTMNVYYFYAAPYQTLENTETVAEIALKNTFGTNINDLLSAMIGLVLLSSLSAFIMIGPRVYYAMARDGLFFKFAATIHPKNNVPHHAIVIQGGVAVLMVLLGSLEQLLIYVGFALGIFPWLAVAGIFIARHLKIGEESAVNVWGFPWIPLFFLTSTLALMIMAVIHRPQESVAAILTVLLGIPFYYLWMKQKRNHASQKFQKPF